MGCAQRGVKALQSASEGPRPGQVIPCLFRLELLHHIVDVDQVMVVSQHTHLDQTDRSPGGFSTLPLEWLRIQLRLKGGKCFH